MSARKLYDLAAADPALRFSPYCWRTKLALAHKGLETETIPWRFTEKAEIAFSGQKMVPVLVDDGTTIADSQAIAEYLEATYPDRPSLFGGAQGLALTSFIRHWSETILQPALAKILAPDIFKLIHPKDVAYFRESREPRFGMTMEELAAGRGAYIESFRAMLTPLRHTLKGQAFLGGAGPLYADHIVCGALIWANKTSSTPLLEANAQVTDWINAVLDHYGEKIQR